MATAVNKRPHIRIVRSSKRRRGERQQPPVMPWERDTSALTSELEEQARRRLEQIMSSGSASEDVKALSDAIQPVSAERLRQASVAAQERFDRFLSSRSTGEVEAAVDDNGDAGEDALDTGVADDSDMTSPAPSGSEKNDDKVDDDASVETSTAALPDDEAVSPAGLDEGEEEFVEPDNAEFDVDQEDDRPGDTAEPENEEALAEGIDDFDVFLPHNETINDECQERMNGL